MVSVSLFGQVRQRRGKLFLHNPDGVFEVRVKQSRAAELLKLSGKNVIIGGTIHAHKNGSYIDLHTYQPTSHRRPGQTDHLNTLLQVSLGAI